MARSMISMGDIAIFSGFQGGFGSAGDCEEGLACVRSRGGASCSCGRSGEVASSWLHMQLLTGGHLQAFLLTAI